MGTSRESLENGNLDVPARLNAASGDHCVEDKGAIVRPALQTHLDPSLTPADHCVEAPVSSRAASGREKVENRGTLKGSPYLPRSSWRPGWGRLLAGSETLTKRLLWTCLDLGPGRAAHKGWPSSRRAGPAEPRQVQRGSRGRLWPFHPLLLPPNLSLINHGSSPRLAHLEPLLGSPLLNPGPLQLSSSPPPRAPDGPAILRPSRASPALGSSTALAFGRGIFSA